MSDDLDPILYHTHHCLHLEDIPFWLELAEKSPGPILELGCGSGRVTTALARAGHRVLGLDKDFDMLAFHRQNSPVDLSSLVDVVQADFTRLHLVARFGLVMLPCNTYSTLPEKARVEALVHIKRHMQPDGLFAVSLPNPITLMNLPENGAAELEEIFTHPITGAPVQVSSAWKRTSRQCTVYWHYDHLLPEGIVRRSTMQITHQLETIEVLRGEFNQAGFTITHQLGDYDHSPYQADSPYWIILATHHLAGKNLGSRVV